MNNQLKLWERWHVTKEEWNDWRWHLEHRITTVDELTRFIELTAGEMKDIAACLKKFRMAITPYYAGLWLFSRGECLFPGSLPPGRAERLQGFKPGTKSAPGDTGLQKGLAG